MTISKDGTWICSTCKDPECGGPTPQGKGDNGELDTPQVTHSPSSRRTFMPEEDNNLFSCNDRLSLVAGLDGPATRAGIVAFLRHNADLADKRAKRMDATKTPPYDGAREILINSAQRSAADLRTYADAIEGDEWTEWMKGNK